MSKILSVTIPTYNVEKYLKQCLDSFIIPEIMDDMEILIVNDGSTDSSPVIAEEYTEKYPDTFKLINKENGGHGSTINTGIANATGKYFKVVDSDDWVDTKAMINLMEALKKGDCDLIYSNYYWVDNATGTKTVEFHKPFDDVVYNEEYSFEKLPHEIFLKMHGYTVKTDILRQIRKIDENCFYVDMEFVVYPIPYINTVKFIPDFVYQYRIGLPNQSMNVEKMKRNSTNFDRVLKALLRFYNENVELNITDSKKKYIENVIARLVASRMKIYLSFPFSKKVCKDMRLLDEKIKNSYPAIYQSNINSAVGILRRTGYKAYPLARFCYYIKQKS